jgi:hypothetical protein
VAGVEQPIPFDRVLSREGYRRTIGRWFATWLREK